MDCCYLLLILNTGPVVIRFVAMAELKKLASLTRFGIPVPVCTPELTYRCH